ncbi:polysaccharide biosynthesis/export protein [Phocaeicola plebeius DSM 17135]|uniref:Polysaccharide biosynthesis/export protein n=1 Tax=Phocaeicola plebeius (strain DSM 17135 / JCM 12973 / CCUG 54634 / M2) TaxID=484018 RepID=B5CTK1_PHOPM|nr:polysaccharide biosynthesis/export family protein [Phocaeicola plebeius]EDY97289.1 polysaccharide biosynthesis/export protein [Phocaeicola plebeius DSM 17135]
MRKFKELFFSCFVLFLITGCASRKNVLYLQDMDKELSIEQKYEIYIQKDDLLGILVNCKEQELAIPFNLPRVDYNLGTSENISFNRAVTSTSEQGNSSQLGYTVDTNGDIDFPILGKLHVVGLTRLQLKNLIETRLKEENLIKDAIVTINFLNFKIYMLGEIASPGMYNIKGERITLLEAISMAGDLTIQGRRDRVVVIREKDGIRMKYYNDLRSKDLFKSPSFYLQQNDVVYVEPNKTKASQATSRKSNFSLGLSVVTSLISITTLILSLIN